MEYEVLYDANGVQLHPGDYVSLKLYPKCSLRGWVVISKTWKTRDNTPALSIISAVGIVYLVCGSKRIKKLKVQKPMPEIVPVIVAQTLEVLNA